MKKDELLQPAMVNMPRKPGQPPLKVTRAQWESIKRQFNVSPDGTRTFEQFCWRVDLILVFAPLYVFFEGSKASVERLAVTLVIGSTSMILGLVIERKRP